MTRLLLLAITLSIVSCSRPEPTPVPPTPPVPPIPAPPAVTTFKLDGATVTIEGQVNTGVDAKASDASQHFETARDLLDKL